MIQTLTTPQQVDEHASAIIDLIENYRERFNPLVRPQQSLDFTRRLMAGGASVLFLCYYEDRCVGYLLATIAPMLFGSVPSATVIGFYARPENVGVTWTMTSMFEKWASEHGAKLLFTHVSAGAKLDKWVGTMTRRGWQVESVHFMKEA